MRKNKKIKGVSTQSIIIGAIITAVIAASGLVLIWPSVDKSKVNIIAETLDEQHAFLVHDAAQNFKTLYSSQKQSFTDGDADYLDELVKMGAVSYPPFKFFHSKNVIWEIRQVNDFGIKPNFYIHLSSDDVEDQAMIDKALKQRGYKQNIIGQYIIKL